MSEEWNVSRYLIHRLREVGIGHLFGVPGDYVLDFLDEVVKGPINWVGTCNELNAGYAADGYARMNGAGAAVVTYGVGGLSILNAVAGAYAEQVPVIIISGAPPARRREAGALVHHLVSDYYLQLDIYRKVTTDAAILLDANTAPDEIDRVIRNSVTRKLPAYLELPADIALAPCRMPAPLTYSSAFKTNEENLKECVLEAARLINSASNPMALAGVELLRFNLGSKALGLIESAEIPFATMLSSKSLLPELHPQFVGIYQGGWSKESVKRQVEDCDCLLSLGVWITDLDTGLFSMNFDNRRMIKAGGGQVSIGNHFYPQIGLEDFIQNLTPMLECRSYLASHPSESYQPKHPFIPAEDGPLTAKRLYECINYHLADDMVLLAEPGDAFCAAPEFHIEEAENFIVQVYYASIGYCTPAALGVGLARKGKRPLILAGDGAFQMTAQEVSTLIREKIPALIVLINNDGYLVERMLHQDGAYNDIQMWNYSRLPAVFDKGSFSLGLRVETEKELEEAILTAISEESRLVFIEAIISGGDCSRGLERLGASFKKAQQK
ncbi:MAG: thiamine pyrophosphate-binding protein [Bacteroidota bacterium]